MPVYMATLAMPRWLTVWANEGFERRRSPRLLVRCVGRLHIDGAREHTSVEVREIGANGCVFAMPAGGPALAAGHQVAIGFVDGAGMPCVAKGRIARELQGGAYAIAFDSANAELLRCARRLGRAPIAFALAPSPAHG